MTGNAVQLREQAVEAARLGRIDEAAMLHAHAARALLGSVGYDPEYGARPPKRAVQHYLQDPLADAILRGETAEGATVRVEEGEGGLAVVDA